MPIKRILVATDFSHCAQAALDLAVELATAQKASILLFHAYDLPTYVLPEGQIIALDGETMERIEGSIDQALDRERRRVSERIGITVARAEGAAADQILEQAERVKCDLIVMGSHGRRGFRRLMMGSVAERVLRSAPVPVLVAREGSVGQVAQPG